MATGVIPTLSRNNQILENSNDKLIYILKYMFYSPGWISNWYDNLLLSMRKSMAKYTEDSTVLVPHLQTYINDVIHKYYPDYSCTIEVIRDEANDANYSMDISIVDSVGTPVIQLGRIRKDESNLFVIEGK